MAVRILARDGHLRVSRTGQLAVAPGEREAPTVPVLATLLAAVRREPDVTLHDLLTEPRFLPFQQALDEHRPDLGDRDFGGYRTAALLAAGVVSFGMGMNAMLLGHGVPGLSGEPANWILAWTVPWAALSLLAAAWPPDHVHPWPLFTRRCRLTVRRALAGERPESVWWSREGARRPYAAPPPTTGRRRPHAARADPATTRAWTSPSSSEKGVTDGVRVRRISLALTAPQAVVAGAVSANSVQGSTGRPPV